VLQIAFMVLLSGVLAAAVVSCAVMGLLQIRRTRVLAREANKLGMRFSRDDPFDVSRRYANFALMSSGHSLRASNVIYGRLSRRPVRAFDFRYEVGHGTRRVTRRYSVVVMETDRQLPRLLMWHDRDAGDAPLEARQGDGHLACWTYRGSDDLAASARDACLALADDAVSIETSGTSLMAFSSAGSRGRGYAERLTRTVAALETLDRAVWQSAPSE